MDELSKKEFIENFDNHDCHASEEDGCSACNEMMKIQEEELATHGM